MTQYTPHTPKEVSQMLQEIGVPEIDNLFSEIPEELRLGRSIALPEGICEADLTGKMSDLANQNISTSELVCFLGGGAYDHLIPPAIKHLISRGDFFTAYTPYQPEVSQGTLMAIYEYQSLMCELTGMDVANASMYEGATALAESANIALHHTNRKNLVVSETLHPHYREVLKEYTRHSGAKILEIPFEDGVTDLAKLGKSIDATTAAVIIQYPNFFGCIEDLEAICALAKSAGAPTIVSTYPISLGMLTPPGAFGVDIVCGEGQSLGIPLSFGGPYLGFIAVKEPLLRKIPGRLCGRTVDNTGKRGFVLTLQAREQHIRREKAGSNICSNQALMALTATVYLSLVGNEGFREIASHCFQKAHYLKRELGKVANISSPFVAPFFNEFVISIPQAKKVVKRLSKEGIMAGLLLEEYYPQLKDHILVAVTEKRTVQEMDFLRNILGGQI